MSHKYFIKTLVLLIIINLVLSWPVLAAEGAGQKDISELSQVDQLAEVDFKEKTSPEPAEVEARSNDNIILPEPLSNRRVNVQAEEALGAAIYSFPLQIPPGRRGLQPDLKLIYSSHQQNQVNFFGYGWDLPTGYIFRSTKKGTNRLYLENDFSLNINGNNLDLKAVSLIDGRHGDYALKDETSSGFYKIKFLIGDYWQVTDKLGTTYIYGLTIGTRQYDPQDSTKIYKWVLEKITDTNNNWIKFEYFLDSNQIYPKKINYTGNNLEAGIFSIEFEPFASGSFVVRPDLMIDYQPVFKVETKYRVGGIIVKDRGQWVRKYELQYDTGNNGSRSLLKSIVESGRNAAGQEITLPPIEFNYSLASTVKANSLWQIPEYFTRSDTNLHLGVRLADVNGDGLTDMLRSSDDYDYSSNKIKKVYLNTGSGWQEDPSWQIPVYFAHFIESTDYGIEIDDVNGDGLSDIIEGYCPNPGGEYARKKVYLNTGSGWQENPVWIQPECFAGSIHAGARLADVNGDGLVDILRGMIDVLGGSYTYNKVYLNTGSGWQEDPSWQLPEYFVKYYSSSSIHKDLGVRLIDINHDGLTDFLRSSFGEPETIKRVYLNTGHGWTADSTWVIPEYFIDYNTGGSYGVRLIDINGDGLADILRGQTGLKQAKNKIDIMKVYLNTGRAWVYETSINLAQPFSYGSGSESIGTIIVDINNDNLPDILRSELIDFPHQSIKLVFLNNGLGWTTINKDSEERELIVSNQAADLLTKIKDQVGGQTEVEYAPSAQARNAQGGLLNPALPFILPVVKKIVADDGFTAVKNTAYEYANGYYYTAEQYEQKFAGFGKVTKTDPEGNVVKTYYHQGNGTDTALGEREDHISKRSRPYRQEFYNNTGALEKVVVQRWYGTDLGNGRHFVNLQAKLETDYTASKAPVSKAAEYIYDSVGNLDQEINLGKVSVDSIWEYSDTEADKIKRDIDYLSNDTEWIKALPEKEQVFNYSDLLQHKKNYYYDYLVKDAKQIPDKGNLTQVDMQLGAKATPISLKLSYDGTYGLVTQEKDPRDNTTTINYDIFYYLYPKTKINANGQLTTYTHDLATGQVLTTTDPNGNTTTKILDALGRVKEVWTPDEGGTSRKKQEYTYVDTALNKSVSVKNYFNSSDYIEAVEHYDGLGQLIQKRTRIKDDASDPDNYAVIDYTYDGRGQVIRQSIPYVKTGSARTTADTSQSYTSYTYDSLGRKLSEKYQSSTVTYTITYQYDGWTTTATDPEGNVRRIYNDAFGNIIQIDEINEGSTHSTYYQYNALQKLTKITDAQGNARNFTYDTLGRRTKVEDLHKSDDLTFGSWNYGYDSASNLTQVTDPKAQVINYTYDLLNRVLTEDFIGQSGTEATYTYDTSTQGIGRLSQINTANFNVSYQYNNQGNIKQETKTIKGESYNTYYTYDWQGNPLQITYSDGFVVKYTYNPVGQLNKIEKKESGGSFSSVITDIDYSALGQVRRRDFANGVVETNTYDANELYRLKHKQSVKGSTNLQYLDYVYDKIGNITQLTDASATSAARTINYTYDNLSRLRSASGTYSQSFDYDQIGNIRHKHGLVFSYNDSYTTSYANPQAVTKINGQSYTYDQNGNLLTDPDGRSYTYDYQNRLISLTKSGVVTNYLYDHQRQRIYKETLSLNQSTIYVNKFYEIEKNKYDKFLRRNIYAGNELVAVAQKSEVMVLDLDSDGYYSDVDCDDSDPSEHPGITWRKDQDNDNYYSLTSTCQRGDSQVSYWYASGHDLGLDCNDSESSIHPGAVEICGDGVDQDCSGADLSCEAVDNDGDGYTELQGDCDDADSAEHPGVTWYLDVDGDNYYAGSHACDRGSGDPTKWYASSHNLGVDCNDSDAQINPGRTEIPYDGKDNDCNQATLDDDLDRDGYGYSADCDDTDGSEYPGITWYLDVDNDYYYSDTHICDRGSGDSSKWYASSHNLGVDCNDADEAVNPGRTEIPYDGKDNDCNQATLDDDLDGDGYGQATDCDDADPLEFPGVTWRKDQDNDNYYSLTSTCQRGDSQVSYWYASGHDLGLDCNDSESSIHPGAVEICGDGVDQDCSGADLSCEAVDNDGDGYTELQGDCDDADSAEHPGVTWYLDADNDYYYVSTHACNRGGGDPSTWYADSHNLGVDCNDSEPLIHPGAFEHCDGIDQACDGLGIEVDADSDSWLICAGDCNDNNSAIHPTAEELCNGFDDDCDDLVLEEIDEDDDGVMLCELDCDDSNPIIYPGAEELCDGLDNDCDGALGIEEIDEDSDGYLICEFDCDDTAPAINPGQSEIPNNGVDEDCNPITPDADRDLDSVEDGIDNCSDYYNPDQRDIDGDGIGDLCETELEADDFLAASGSLELGLPAWDIATYTYTDQIRLKANPQGAPEGLILPLSVTFTEFATDPAGYHLTASNRDFGDGGVGSGWIYQADDATAGDTSDGVVNPETDEVSRVWEISDPEALPWHFWAEVASAGQRGEKDGKIILGSFDSSGLCQESFGEQKTIIKGSLTDLLSDDGQPELYVTTTASGLVMLNRFTVNQPGELKEISVYFGQPAVGSQVDFFAYFDPTGQAQTPVGLSELFRATTTVTQSGFQNVPVENVALTPNHGSSGVIFIGAANLSGNKFSLGLDSSEPHANLGLFSKDGGLTFQPQSDQLIMSGNFMIRATLAKSVKSVPGISYPFFGPEQIMTPVEPLSAALVEPIRLNQLITTGRSDKFGTSGDQRSSDQRSEIGSSKTPESESKATYATYYYHLDHLGGTSVVTDESGNILQVLDYYPYGTTRIDEHTSYDSKSKFTGQKLDPESGIYYYNARYYNQEIGRFLSQDPVFLAVGDSLLEQKTGLKLQQYLVDPQLLNSYSYARNNPVLYNDQEGEFIPLLIFAGYAAATWIAASGIAITAPLMYGQIKAYAQGNHELAQAFGEGVMTTFGFAEIGITSILLPAMALEGATMVRSTTSANDTNKNTEIKTINPSKVRYSQNSMSYNFTDPSKGNVDTLANELRSGKIDPLSVDPIRVYEKNGELWSLDHRRLESFQRAKVDIPYRYATPEELKSESWKINTQTDGLTIKIRGKK